MHGDAKDSGLIARMICALIVFVPATLWERPAAAQAECSHCDQRLLLSETEWHCLRNLLPSLRATSTEIVFFSLSERACQEGRYRSASALLPGVDREAARLFILSRRQVECLAARAGAVQSSDEIVIDLASACAQTSGVRP